MKVKKNKCPVCGSKMTPASGSLVCGGCGYRITDKSSLSGGNPSASAPFRTYLAVAIIFIIAITAIALPVLFLSIRENLTTVSNSAQTGQPEYPPASISSVPSDAGNEAASAETGSVTLPESDMFRQFISSVFQKDYSEVTADELAEITSLHIFNNENYYKTIAYTRKDGQSGSFYYDRESVPTSDLVCFTGLEYLHLEHESLAIGDLNGLDHLTGLRCGNSLYELARIIDPAQLTALGIDADIFLRNLNGIEVFTNVTHLCLDGGFFLEDISALSSLENLSALEITDGDSIKSFQVLYDMPKLERLSIDSEALRDIGFISNMPALRELSVQNSDIRKIDALADCKDTLTKLDLSYNYQIKDYNVVSQLSGLTDLTLFISYSFDEPSQLPDFSGMPELTRLSLGNYDNLERLIDAPGLQELTIADVYISDLPELTALTELTCLNLIDMSCEAAVIESVMELPQLEIVDLSGSYIWGNIDGLFTLPRLKECRLNNCTAGFDMERSASNESLEVLEMNNVTLKALTDGKWDYNAYDSNNMDPEEYSDMFRCYPGLQELYLTANELEDISFAEALPDLRILDITDNYVTDLSPLTGLQNLEAVMCADNPIADNKGLEEKLLTEN